MSINHRIAEFLASYFDVIFAINKKTHPGEKRLISICRVECELLPNNFEENLNKLMNLLGEGEIVIEIISEIVTELKKNIS